MCKVSPRPLGGRGVDHCICVVLRLAVLGCNRGISAYQADRSSLGLVFDRAGADIDGRAAKHNVYWAVAGDVPQAPELIAELVALCIALLSVIGVFRIKPLLAEVVQSTKASQQSREDFKAFAEVCSDFFWAMDDELRLPISRKPLAA